MGTLASRLGSLEDWLTAGLFVLAVLFCFHRLSYPDLQMWDEADNAVVIMESLSSESPLQLQRMGKPYFDKPPLWYYVTQAVVTILGASELSFRLVTAAAGALLILFVILAAREFFSPLSGIAAGLFMLAVRQHFVFRPAQIFATHNMRSADSDVLMILFAFAAFWAFGRRVEGWPHGLWLGSLFSALALLSKGPPGLAPAVAFALYQLLKPGRRIRITAREVGFSALVFALVAIPWHAFMAYTWGDVFLDQYPRYVLFRLTSGLESHTPEPTYYFRILTTRRVFFSLELATLAVLFALTDREKRGEYPRTVTLLVLGLTFAVLNISKTKIAWYLLPLYPFLAVLVGGMVERLERWRARSGVRYWQQGSSAAIVVLLCMMSLVAAHNLYSVSRLPRGNLQTFFSAVSDRCGTDVVYADSRESIYTRYFLERYRISRGELGDSSCAVVLPDTELPGTFTDQARITVRGGAFLLWQPIQGTSRGDTR